MKRSLKGSGNRKSGQVMLEYVIAVVVFLGLVFLSYVLLDAFNAYGERALDLISWEYP